MRSIILTTLLTGVIAVTSITPELPEDSLSTAPSSISLYENSNQDVILAQVPGERRRTRRRTRRRVNRRRDRRENAQFSNLFAPLTQMRG